MEVKVWGASEHVSPVHSRLEDRYLFGACLIWVPMTTDNGNWRFVLEKTKDWKLWCTQGQAGKRVDWSTVVGPGVKAPAMQKEKADIHCREEPHGAQNPRREG